MNLTEATVLALEGKLNESEDNNKIINAIMEVTDYDYEEAKDIFDKNEYDYIDANSWEEVGIQLIEASGSFEKALGMDIVSYLDIDSIRDDLYDDEYEYFVDEYGDKYSESKLDDKFEKYLDKQIQDILKNPYSNMNDSQLENYFDYESFGIDKCDDFEVTNYGAIKVY